MIRSRTVFFCAAIAALAGCGIPGIPQAGPYGSVQGIVSDRATNQPIGGATVTIDSVLSTSTTANGAFRLDNVPLGPFDYVVNASGYQQVAGEGTAAAGAPLALNVQMDK